MGVSFCLIARENLPFIVGVNMWDKHKLFPRESKQHGEHRENILEALWNKGEGGPHPKKNYMKLN